MVHKYFSFDKNYILEEAQLSGEKPLTEYMVKKVISEYLQQYNPLGLLDDTVSEILKYNYAPSDIINKFYKDLAGIYRYQFGDNQLELLFDGSDHYYKYKADWERQFTTWIEDFCSHHHFFRSILELTVFNNGNEHTERLIHQRLKWFIEQNFDLRVYKYKGIVKLQIA